MARRGGSGGMEMLLIMFVLLMSSMFSLVGGYFIFKQEPGDPCTGDDDNADYQIDENGKCVFLSCKTGYELVDSNCVVVSDPVAGDLCTGEVVGGKYTLNTDLECVISGCKVGYEQDASVTDSIVCNQIPTPEASDCVGSWSDFGECSEPCGGGTKTKTYSITTPAAAGGSACEYADGATETVQCNTAECPIDCQGDYEDWEPCDIYGKQYQRFKVQTAPNSTGEQCPPIKVRDCSTN